MASAAWSIKGVDRDTRGLAKQAAQKNGMTLGEWMDHIILNQPSKTPGGIASNMAPPANENMTYQQPQPTPVQERPPETQAPQPAQPAAQSTTQPAGQPDTQENPPPKSGLHLHNADRLAQAAQHQQTKLDQAFHAQARDSGTVTPEWVNSVKSRLRDMDDSQNFQNSQDQMAAVQGLQSLKSNSFFRGGSSQSAAKSAAKNASRGQIPDQTPDQARYQTHQQPYHTSHHIPEAFYPQQLESYRPSVGPLYGLTLFALIAVVFWVMLMVSVLGSSF